MVSRRKAGKQPRGRPAPRQPEPVDEDLVLGDELIRQAHEGQADLAAGFRKFLRQLGIRGKAPGAKKLRERPIQTGIVPDGNEFSRGILEMREE